MKCPQCHHANPANATECAECGVVFAHTRPRTQRQQPPPRAPCAHANCEKPALCKMKTPTGWAALCEHHYELLIQTRADQACQRLGLKNTEQKRQYVRAYLDATRKASSLAEQ